MNKDRFKFRVWNKQTKNYMKNMVVDKDGTLYFRGAMFPQNPSEYIIEQCAGFSDKNGNLIYEGDIVIGRKEIVVCEMIEYKDVVEYKDGAYFPFNWTGVYKPEKFEIIGNIHEQKNNKQQQ